MSKENTAIIGAWYCIKTNIPVDLVDDIVEYYHNFWRYVEAREEALNVKSKSN